MIAAPQNQSHDAKGRFVPGNPGGPGRPPLEYEKKKLEEFRSRVSSEKFLEVVDAVLAKASAGDLQACKLVFDYILPAKQLLIKGLPSTVVIDQSQKVTIDPWTHILLNASPDQLRALRPLIPEYDDDDNDTDEDQFTQAVA